MFVSLEKRKQTAVRGKKLKQKGDAFSKEMVENEKE